MPKTVMISAGHSERDPGAVAGKVKESLVAVRLRDKILAHLKAKGVNAVTDGSIGHNLPLGDAIKILKSAGGLGVEIHLNAAENRAAHGVEALCKPDKRTKAIRLCAAVHLITGIKVRGSEGGYKATNSGQHSKLGFCEAGGIILEVGFISNAADLKAIQDNVDALAEALAVEMATW